MVWMPKFLKKMFYGVKPFDRRRYPRSNPYKDIECSLVYEDNGRRTEIPLVIMNVSRVGMLVSTNEVKIYPKTPVQIKFKNPAQAEPALINAEIVRTYRKKSLRFYYSGLDFQDENQKDIQLLLDLVSKAQK